MIVRAALLLFTLVAVVASAEEAATPGALFTEGLAKRDRGDLWEAEDLLRRAADREPSAERLAELGATRFMIAKRMYEAGEGAGPGGSSSIQNLLRDGARALNLSLEMGESIRAHVYLGLAKIYLGDARGGALELDRALQIGPKDALALGEAARAATWREDHPRAAELYRRLAAVRPDDPVVHLALGKALYFSASAKEAEESLVRALCLNPDLAEGYAYLRGLYLNRGRYVEMERALRRVLDAHEDHPRALSDLGVSLSERGESRAAAEIFEKLIALDGENLEARCRLGWLQAFKFDSLDEGLKLFGEVLSKDPTNERALQSLEYLMRRGIVEERYEMAVRVLDVWCAADPQNARAQAYRGLALRRLGRYAEAVSAYTAAREADPMQAWIVSDLGLVHMAAGRLDEAERVFREALEIDSEFLDALENLGMLERLRGDPVAARKWFEDALAAARVLQPQSVPKFRRYLDILTWAGR